MRELGTNAYRFSVAWPRAEIDQQFESFVLFVFFVRFVVKTYRRIWAAVY